MKKCEICGSYIITREDMEAMRNAHKEPGQHGDPVGEPGISISASGRWIQSEEWAEDYTCSLCGNTAFKDDHGNYNVRTKYCPHCGAKMKKE
jgi:predicted RNA-binding Zn-ribbon protein involved in translation (DUF1610 family)